MTVRNKSHLPQTKPEKGCCGDEQEQPNCGSLILPALTTQADGSNLEDHHETRDDQHNVVNRLLVVHQLSLMLQTQLDQNALLRIMLSGITAGEALGFNRALVLLLDDDKCHLVGALGVGPVNEEECRHIWAEIASRGLTLNDFVNEFDSLNRYQKAQFNTETQKIRWLIGNENDLLTRTIKEKVCYHVTPDQFSDIVPEPLAQMLETSEFVAAPLVVTGNALGVVVADNKFSGNPITNEEIQLLSIVANQTAAALSHIRLFRELEKFQDHLAEKVREAVAEKQQAQEDMVRRAKMATIGEMAVVLAHEIRNPLTAIRGFAQRLKRLYDRPATVKSYTEIIVEEVDRLNRVLGDTLDYARLTDATYIPGDLNEVVRRVVKLMQERMGNSGIICETELTANLPTCCFDETQITQVAINLLKNAAESMADGGVITFRTGQEDHYCFLEVDDTGCGISEKELAKVLEPFYTTKTRGSGLGLSFTKRVLEEHGGDVLLTSEKGVGTRVRLRLPIGSEAPRVDEVIEKIDRAQPLVKQGDRLARFRDSNSQQQEGDDDGADSGR